jgi:hypothetical protein
MCFECALGEASGRRHANMCVIAKHSLTAVKTKIDPKNNNIPRNQPKYAVILVKYPVF